MANTGKGKDRGNDDGSEASKPPQVPEDVWEALEKLRAALDSADERFLSALPRRSGKGKDRGGG